MLAVCGTPSYSGQSRLECRRSFTFALRDSEVVKKAVRLLSLVIPAQAGIQARPSSQGGNVAEKLTSLGSGFRRNDAQDAIFLLSLIPKTKN